MTDINNLFFELIRVAIGNAVCLSHTPTAKEWQLLYEMAKKQSLVGICFAGVQRLQMQHQSPPEQLLLQWMGMAAKILQRNEKATRDIARVREHFEKEGFYIVLLKGQGNLCCYKEDIQQLRTSGDIDVWVLPKGLAEMSLEECMKNDEYFLKWLWEKDASIRHCYIHVCYPFVKDAEVETHFRPSYINSPWRNRRFQRWMMEKALEQIENVVTLPHSDVKVAVPTTEFNIVYQLSHLYRHIFDDGLGFRQVLDYYFVLMNSTQKERQEVMGKIKEFGMLRFAGALMYVLHEVLGMDESRSLCKADAVAGDFLQREIMTAGNFGHYDARSKVTECEKGVQRLIRRQKRNMRFLKYYAEEVLCVPIYRVFQEMWRIEMNLKCK